MVDFCRPGHICWHTHSHLHSYPHIHTQYISASQDHRLLYHWWYMPSFPPLYYLAHCLRPSVSTVKWSPIDCSTYTCSSRNCLHQQQGTLGKDTHIYTCTNTCAFICTHTYTNIHTLTRTHTHTHTQLHICDCMDSASIHSQNMIILVYYNSLVIQSLFVGWFLNRWCLAISGTWNCRQKHFIKTEYLLYGW